MLKFDILLNIIHAKQDIFKYLPFKMFPIDTKKIVISNYAGLGYGCNPKYIAEELLKRNKDLKIVWLLNPQNMHLQLPNKIKKVDKTSIRAFYELCTSKIWIDNYHKVSFIKKSLTKRVGQYYIQTWHGSLGIKKIEADVSFLNTTKSWKSDAIKNAEMQDYLISNSQFETEVFKTAFWGKGKILELGHARNDIFFRDNKQIKEKVYQYFDIKDNSKILIYAPTFRQGCSTKLYDIDYGRLRENLKSKFGGEWVIFVRLHRNIKTKPNLQNHNFVYDASLYDDVQELLTASDVAITDYSSCIFDFMLSKKAGFIYAPDIEEYNHDRGFYYSIYETPFPISKNNDELEKVIQEFDYKTYKEKVDKFLNEKGCIDDGRASERIVDLVEDLIQK